MQEPIP